MTDSTTSIIRHSPIEILRDLIRFDTTNPPGNERACILYIDGLLREAGFETTLLARDENRPNLIARLPGRGESPPLLLYGHVDVVTTAGQEWTYPPFEARLVDGVIWGRGALDMKGGVAMMVAGLLRARAEGLRPAGDIVLAVLADEEAGSDYGAMFLVGSHPEQFEGIRYALGEFGGATMWMGNRRFYPIQVTEKQMCWVKATVRGQGGHGSAPLRGEAMARLSRLLGTLDRRQLPVHVTPVVQRMLEGIAEGLPFPANALLRGLTKPPLTNGLLRLMGEKGRMFASLLHNTVSPTILHGSTKINVIPAAVSVELDGRLLPGHVPEEMLEELRAIVGDDVELEVMRHEAGPSKIDWGLYEALGDVIREFDPEAMVIPLAVPGCTDARSLAQLGIQSYGFTPMKLPKDFSFFPSIHGADERVPVEAIEFGANAIYRMLERYKI